MLLTDPATLLHALLLALALDALIGEPAWLYRRVPHPVALIGAAISGLERRWLDLDEPAHVLRRRGLLLGVLIVAASALAGLGLQWLCLRMPFGWLLLGLLMSSLLAQRGLYEHVAAVAAGLREGLAQGRAAVAQIVGRDPEQLDAPAVARAAIEFHRREFLRRRGGAAALGRSARPARHARLQGDQHGGQHDRPSLAALRRFRAFRCPPRRRGELAAGAPGALLILAAASLCPGTTPAAGWRALRRDAALHRSVNAGWPEAAMAGSLGLRLAGPRRYGGELVEDAWMGNGTPLATPADIGRALKILVRACALAGALLALALVPAGT